MLAGTEQQSVQPIITRQSGNEWEQIAGRILLAEDNITNQKVALVILKKLGLRADAVANGAEAIKSLELIPYDLVLMDVQMPVMDGLEATQIIRDPQSAVLNHHIPIIAMTAHAMQGYKEKCLKAGMDAFISKPVSPQTIARVLKQWLPSENKRSFMPSAEGAIPVETLKPAPVVFNKTEFISRMMDDESFAREIGKAFLDDIPNQIKELNDSIHGNDTVSAKRYAHTIKGAALNVSGEALSIVAFEMEKSAAAGDLGNVKFYLPELEKQFARLKEAIIGFLNQQWNIAS